MKVAFFNSAVVRAPGLLMCKGAGWGRRDVPVRFGLIQLANGKFHLVDTGYGPRVTEGRRSASLRVYNRLLRPILLEESSPKAVLASVGATPDDVEAVIVTHFHADHVARLDEFPRARIVTGGRAAQTIWAATHRQAVRHGVFKELLPHDLMSRLDPIEGKPMAVAHPTLGQGHDLLGDGSLLAIDLPGHADGHFGLFWREDAGPTLYATDATWSMKALLEDRTPAISRKVVFDDPEAGRRTERRIRDFASAGGKVLLCHDWVAR
jgi:glyoxylase-like metal-dependent hydrolase (beta-lactamase superfamily II)